MNYTLSTKASDDLYKDLCQYMKDLEDYNATAIKILMDYHIAYSLRFKKTFFTKNKMNFEEFLNAITFNTTLVIYPAGEHFTPFSHVRPKVYMWSMKDKKLAKLVGVSYEDSNFKAKNNLIASVCAKMYNVQTIRDVQTAIQRLNEYATYPYTIDDNMVNLHRTVLNGIQQMKLFKGRI